MTTAQPAILLSIYKPIFFVVVAGFWAYAVSYLDKDLLRFHLPRQLFNGAQVALGVAALVVWLVLPFFWLGLVMATAMMAGGLVGYHFYRNTKVPPEAHWKLELSTFRNRVGQMQKDLAPHKTGALRMLTTRDEALDLPPEGSPQAQAQAIFTQVLEFAIPRNAECIEIVTDTKKTGVVVQVDGIGYPQVSLEPPQGLALTDYLKQTAGLDVSDRRRKQIGRAGVVSDKLGKHSLEFTTSGTTREVTLAIRIDPGNIVIRKLPDLGLLESQIQQLTAALGQRGKVVLVAAPPGQGLTTTLYSLLARHDPYTESVMTLEERVERELEGVAHETIRTERDAPQIEHQVASIMLREPKALMLGQLADPESAKIVARHANEIRVYAGLRQNDTTVALRSWGQAVGDLELAANAVCAVVTQRLVRLVCTTCRQAYKPDAEMLRKLNLSADRIGQFYKHSGKISVNGQVQDCPACLGIGYKGRMGIFEVMALDDEARALAAGAQYDQLKGLLRKKRMVLLQEAAMARVVEGRTTISELTRTIGAK